MKRDCEMARDLMPLCVDGVASEGSQEFVAAHAASCKECAEVYRQMREALRSEQSPAQARAENDQAAFRIRRHLRARTMRNVLLGLVIGLIIAACGLWGYNRIAVIWSRPMATDRYEMGAYSRPDGSLILVLRAPGSNGYSSWVEEDGGSILYVAAHQPALPGRKVAGDGVWLFLDYPGKPLSRFDEIRQGTPDNYRTVWTRGEDAPACSGEFEAYLRNQEEQRRSAIVQDGDFSYAVGEVREGEAPVARTQEEWEALLEEGARLREAVPELQ